VAKQKEMSGGIRIDRTLYCLVLFVAGATTWPLSAANAEVLKGEVQTEGELMRIQRPEMNQNGSADLRLDRTPVLAPQRPQSGLVDTSAFAPLKGSAQQGDANLGLMKPGQFGAIPNDKFDLGAERGSRALVVAWELWHKQLSQAIYARWSQTASVAGSCTLKLTITKNRMIQVTVVHPSGNPIFDQGLMDAILSLNGNPGLTFPSQSQRQFVALESDYVAGHNIDPGYSWVKDDYEKVHQSY
jgi:hypothetical protein